MSRIDCIDAVRVPAPKVILDAQSALAYGGPNGAPSGNNFRNWDIYASARPDLVRKGWLTSVALTCVSHCRCYDIEPGGGQNKNIGIFMRNADRTHGKPWLYTFESNGLAMIHTALAMGFHQDFGDGKGDFYVLSAHPGVRAGKHICSPHVCGAPFTANGTQWLFHGDYDASVLSDYMLPEPVVKPPSPYLMFPADVGDHSLPNRGNERLLVEQVDGALAHPDKFHDYLKGVLYGHAKMYRDRLWRVSHYEPPDFRRPRPKPDWSDHRGARWQAINNRMKKIAALP